MEKNNAADLNLFSLSPERFASILTSLLPSIGRLEELFNLVFQYVSTNFSIRGMQLARLEGAQWQRACSFPQGPLPWERDYEKKIMLAQHLNKALAGKSFCYFSWALSDGPTGLLSHPLEVQPPLFMHHFLFPLFSEESFLGVIHYWFSGENDQQFITRQYELLIPIHSAMARGLEEGMRTRKWSLVPPLWSQSPSLYLNYLEELALNKNDAERTGFLLVNYSRELACSDRCCLFSVPLNRKGFAFLGTQDFDQARLFELKTASSLLQVQKQADQALVLKEAGIALIKAANPRHFLEKKVRKKNGNFLFSFLFEEDKPDNRKERIENRQQAPQEPLRIGFALREAGSKERPRQIIEYFQHIPMNWIAAFPLLDDGNRVFGFVTWEGKEPVVASLELFSLLQRICLIGGKSFAQAYFKKKAWLYQSRALKPLFLIPLLMILLLLVAFIPLPMKIKADAVLLPSYEVAVPAMVSARIEAIYVQVGDYVSKGKLLMTLDSTNIKLKIKEIEQDYKKNMAEADLAQNLKQETAMQLARLNALKSQVLLKSLYKDYQYTFVRAPRDGVVMGPHNLASRRGELTQIGEILVQLADPYSWKVKGFLKEEDLTYLAEIMEKNKKALPISFRFLADPTKSYRLALDSTAQFVHGVEIEKGKYEFSFLIPWEEKNIDPRLLKKGFRGKAKIYVGLRPLGEILFRDIVRFLKIHVFFW
ncbi:efflux RND transporter periplasmic adaptor subunit [Candidatus Methylacidiphilum infernorum]|uniref:Membrane-fusion protein n=1 Tax=Methylacidiphilum infernorum (isolate V4) TaxID=481448 RepID=B3DZG6_METI4|nr:biotin/lipoyl-binding protein [Candidatus Methylacidiphilum infernorum]ACD82583.1 Membrane-fusion protein [Methylacidiphilum infernorum V4]